MFECDQAYLFFDGLLDGGKVDTELLGAEEALALILGKVGVV